MIIILNPRPVIYGDFEMYVVQKYPGFCTMGYISPALPPGHGWVSHVDIELEVQLIFYIMKK